MRHTPRIIFAAAVTFISCTSCNVFSHTELKDTVSIESKFISGKDVQVLNQFFTVQADKIGSAIDINNSDNIYLLTKCSPKGVPNKRILNLKIEFTSPDSLKGRRVEIIPWGGGFLSNDTTYSLTKVAQRDELLTNAERTKLLNESPTFKVIELSAK